MQWNGPPACRLPVLVREVRPTGRRKQVYPHGKCDRRELHRVPVGISGVVVGVVGPFRVGALRESSSVSSNCPVPGACVAIGDGVSVAESEGGGVSETAWSHRSENGPEAPAKLSGAVLQAGGTIFFGAVVGIVSGHPHEGYCRLRGAGPVSVLRRLPNVAPSC